MGETYIDRMVKLSWDKISVCDMGENFYVFIWTI